MKKFSKFAAKVCCLVIAASSCAVPGISNIGPSFDIEVSAASSYDAIKLDAATAFGDHYNEWRDSLAVFLYSGTDIMYAADGYGLIEESTLGPYCIPMRCIDEYREVVVTLDDGHTTFHYLKYNSESGVFEEYLSYDFEGNGPERLDVLTSATSDECICVNIVSAGEHGRSDWMYDGEYHMKATVGMPYRNYSEMQWLPYDLIQKLVDYRVFSNMNNDFDHDYIDEIFYDFWSSYDNYGCAYKKAFEFNYGSLGRAVYAVMGNELVLVEIEGERSNGSLYDRIFIPSNLRAGDSLKVSGTDNDGNHQEFSLYAKDGDNPRLPLGTMKLAMVEYCYDSDTSLDVDVINDGVPSNGQYVEAQPPITGGDFVIRDNTGKVIKRGNALIDDWLDVARFSTEKGNGYFWMSFANVKLLEYGTLKSLGATSKQVKNLISNGTPWLIFEYSPLYVYDPTTGEKTLMEYDKYDYGMHGRLKPRTGGFTNIRDDSVDNRLILKLDKYGGFEPYLVSYVLGDFNDDGCFDITDYEIFKTYLSGVGNLLTEYPDYGDCYKLGIKINGDVNKDGKLDKADLKAMQRELKKRGLA